MTERSRHVDRMHGIDAFAFYGETPTSPFETLKVLIYEPVDGQRPDFDELRTFVIALVSRLGRATSRRVVRVPLDLHHPLWVDDPTYEPDDHVHHAALPAPGAADQLHDFVSEVMGRQLDHDRPLWEAWMVEGLEGGRIAVVLKLHHALADGRAVADAIERAHREPVVAVEREVRTDGASLPGRWALVGSALVDLVTTFLDELPSQRRAFTEYRRQSLAASTGSDDVESAQPRAPFSVLNRSAGGRGRVIRFERFPLETAKALARRYDCTINTLMLGICGEAIRRFLVEAEGSSPTRLVAAMPVGEPEHVAVRTRLHEVAPNNSVACPMVPLHPAVDDFGERLEAIASSSTAAVDRTRRAVGHRFDNYLEFLPGFVIRGIDAALKMEQRRGLGANANVIISNVIGPRDELTALGGRLRLVELYSTGNITDLGHLNITVWSYAGTLNVTFYMRKGAIPDPEKIPAYVREVVDELLADEAVAGGSTGVGEVVDASS